MLIFAMSFPVTARANPYILNSSSAIALGVVCLFALIVEAGIVAVFMTFAGLAPVRMVFGFLLTNLVVFSFVFWPLQQRIALPFLETLVVVVDAAAIWLLSRVSAFQADEYRRVGWVLAGVTSAFGNAASFCIGVMASGEPWKVHGPGE
jgi:hypothetical protein